MQNRGRIVEYLCMIYAEHDMKPELLNHLNDLKFYRRSRDTLKEIVNVTKSVKLMIKERIPIVRNFRDRLKIVLHAVKKENEA